MGNGDYPAYLARRGCFSTEDKNMAAADGTGLPQVIRSSIDAHGGAERWNELVAIDATVTAGGFLFTTKGRPMMQRVRVRAWTREARFAMFDFPRVGETSEWIGDEEVRVVDRTGAVLARRAQPRAAFRDWRRNFRWDHLDFVYFAGYATWNYFCAPFLFLRDGFTFEPQPPRDTPSGEWTRMRVIFPASVPTHSGVQDFFFDAQHRLVRLDYTAEVVGSWAHAAHVCSAFESFAGLLFATRRIVKPLFVGDTPFPFPTLVALRFEEIVPRTGV
jgi:hypothetical protein